MAKESQADLSTGGGNMEHSEVVLYGAYSRLPVFMKENPALWFKQAEAIFYISRVTSQEMKYQSVIANLDLDALTQVADILEDPDKKAPYDNLKQRLIQVYGDFEIRRIKQLLEDTKLGNRQPSELLEEMLESAGDVVSRDEVKTLWLRKLPHRMQAVLLATGQEDVEKLGATADKIAEIEAQTEYPTISTARAKRLLAIIEKLRDEVAELRDQTKPRKRDSKMDGEESHVAMISRSRPQHTAPAAKLPQYLLTLAATTVVFAGGTVIGWSSPALPELMTPNRTLSITTNQGSWVGSLLPVGAFIGALPAGTIADIIGRKTTIMVMAVPQIISWVLIYLAQSVNTLYVARLIGGIGLGALSSTVPIYVAEISEDSIRGALGSAFQFMLVTGILYTYILGAVVHYTMLPILCGVINIIFLAVFFRAPESPVYLLKKGRHDQAEVALRRLRGPDYNVRMELNLMEKSLSQSSTVKVSFLQAVTKRASVLALTICLGMMFFQQLSGINIVIFYADSVFRDAGSSLDPAISTIIVGLAQVVSTVISAALIDKAGRKILLQFSGTVMAICLGVLGYFFHLKTNGSDVSSLGMIPLVSVVIYILVFAVGFGPIPWMISGEILPSEIKGIGTGIACALNWSLAFVVTKAFQPLSDAVGPAVTYWIFAGICVLGFFFVTFVVIETKGKSSSEVQEMLSGKKRTSAKGNNVV